LDDAYPHINLLKVDRLNLDYTTDVI